VHFIRSPASRRNPQFGRADERQNREEDMLGIAGDYDKLAVRAVQRQKGDTNDDR
jgi:hypothetical protein